MAGVPPIPPPLINRLTCTSWTADNLQGELEQLRAAVAEKAQGVGPAAGDTQALGARSNLATPDPAGNAALNESCLWCLLHSRLVYHVPRHDKLADTCCRQARRRR